VTFTTVLAALLVGEDETSRWFARVTAENGPGADVVFKEKKLEQETVRGLTPGSGKPVSVRLSSDKHLLTASAREVIANAERWAERVGGSDIGVRHLIAAYVLKPPPAHRNQMKGWGYREKGWRSAFFPWIAERYTAEQWSDAGRRPGPVRTLTDFQQRQLRIKGKALAFPGDPSTMNVLEAAARYHARGKDRWLRLQTVFCAMVETARHNPEVHEAIQPLADAAAGAAGRYDQAFATFFPGNGPAAPNPSFLELDISPRVLNALETARELALAAGREPDGEFTVGVLQLAGALLSVRVEGDADLAAFGIDPAALRRELIKHAQSRSEPVEVWREAMGEEECLQVGRPVDLCSDEPESVVRLDTQWSSDPLGIRGDVETFAALLASRTLEPPLSIGIFGPWGSGKTTFLTRLKAAVDRRREEAKASIAKSQPTPYVSNVVHVEFNAWHFSETALTSSLVDTIFRKLSAYIKNDPELTGKERSDQAFAQLASATRKVEAAEALERAAEAAVEKAQTKLAESRRQAAKAVTSARQAIQRVWSAARGALTGVEAVKQSGVLKALGDTVESTDDLLNRVSALRNRPARLVGDLGWRASLGFAVAVLAIPPLVAWIVGSVLNRGQVVEVLSALAAMLTTIAAWGRKATAAVSKMDEALIRVTDEYEKELEKDRDAVEAQQAVDQANAAAAAASAVAKTANEALAQARAEAANASLPAQMLQVVSTRIDAQAYSKELTSISLARADLEALSRLLRYQRNGSTPAAGDTAMTPTARAVDRVILYIDDLDRCKQEDVVQVLQVVHMLLGFELFVVVVAVDARWVESALKGSYTWLGEGGTERVTPQDYLEKIFQISFWLEPMTVDRAAKFLGTLVPAASRESGPVFSADPAGTGTAGGTVPAIAKVGITGIELDYLRALARYVGTSPRRVKRLVNTYRLIKASLPDGQLAKFLTDASDRGELNSGPYQIVIALLVIATGASAASALILKELAEWDPKDSLDTLVAQLRDRGDPDWTLAARVIETLMGTQKTMRVSDLRGWARKVGRFLLRAPEIDLRLGGEMMR
jgi:hypothetical protein